MKNAYRVLFIVAFVFLCVHTVRLTYQKLYEPRTSALDAYDETVEVDIREAGSLQELIAKYDEAHGAVDAFEADGSHPKIEIRDRKETEPYKSKIKLRNAITQWETETNRISKVRFYWFTGLIFLVLGIVLHKLMNPWVGMSAFIVAFSEMIYWSSPSYFSGYSPEFERLLTNKLLLAWTSLVLLMVAGYFVGVAVKRTREER